MPALEKYEKIPLIQNLPSIQLTIMYLVSEKKKITEFLKIGKEFNIFSEYKISCKKKIKRVKLLKESACRKIAERAKTVMLVEMERERETA